jgi:hypothetical protein
VNNDSNYKETKLQVPKAHDRHEYPMQTNKNNCKLHNCIKVFHDYDKAKVQDLRPKKLMKIANWNGLVDSKMSNLLKGYKIA